MYQTGAAMADQYYLETTMTERRNHPGRVRTRAGKRLVQDERRREKEIENSRAAAVRIRSMIEALEHAVSSLNAGIDAILEGSQVRDPTNFAYPVAARAMCARRDNIQGTIEVLSRQLAKINDTETDF